MHVIRLYICCFIGPKKAVDYIYDINVLNTNGHKAMCFCRPERKRESSWTKPNVKVCGIYKLKKVLVSQMQF